VSEPATAPGRYRIPTGERVSIIVPVRDEESKIGGLLEAIFAQSAYFDEVVITDGASSDATRNVIEMSRAKDDRVVLVVKPGSQCGEGRNHSIRASLGDILVFLDAGMVPEPRWLERVLGPFAADPCLEFVFGRVVFDTAAEGVGQTAFQQIAGTMGYPGPATWVNTVPASGLRRRLWERWGQLPEAVVGEDLLLFKRLEREGIPCARVGEAWVRYFDFPRDVREVWWKWFVRVKVWTQFPEMRGDLVRRFGRVGAAVTPVVAGVALAFVDARWVASLPLILLARTFARAARHGRYFRTFARRPDHWLTSIAVLLTIDGARIGGLLAGCVSSLRRRWSLRPTRA